MVLPARAALLRPSGFGLGRAIIVSMPGRPAESLLQRRGGRVAPLTVRTVAVMSVRPFPTAGAAAQGCGVRTSQRPSPKTKSRPSPREPHGPSRHEIRRHLRRQHRAHPQCRAACEARGRRRPSGRRRRIRHVGQDQRARRLVQGGRRAVRSPRIRRRRRLGRAGDVRACWPSRCRTWASRRAPGRAGRFRS